MNTNYLFLIKKQRSMIHKLSEETISNAVSLEIYTIKK